MITGIYAGLCCVLLALLPRSSSAASIDIAVGTLQAQVEKAFPKTKSSLTLTEPLLALEGATEVVVLCGRWDYAPKALAASTERSLGGRFCAESRLQWNPHPGAVALSAVRMRSLSLGEGQAVPGAALALVYAILPAQLEGVVVYTAPKFIGWAIKNLRPLDGRLQVEF
ncbi:MAG: hypothetical protein ACKOER_03280 [Betaproteobacteria bacterium]